MLLSIPERKLGMGEVTDEHVKAELDYVTNKGYMYMSDELWVYVHLAFAFIKAIVYLADKISEAIIINNRK
ncbi:MAG: hypothetical protein WC479_04545 [Candidatus Izemoplasmatales bacterium]|jgi:hypothetical protein